jgi:hypothetical protein
VEALRLEVLTARGSRTFLDRLELGPTVWWKEKPSVFSERLTSCIAVEPLGSPVPGGDHVLRGHSDDGVVRRLDQQRGQQQGIGGPHLPRGGAFDSLGDFGSQDRAVQGLSPEIVHRVRS